MPKLSYVYEQFPVKLFDSTEILSKYTVYLGTMFSQINQFQIREVLD